jgi:hypothetical protein
MNIWRIFKSWLDDIRMSPLLTRLRLRKIKKNAYEITGVSPFPLDTRIEAKNKHLPVNESGYTGGDRK